VWRWLRYAVSDSLFAVSFFATGGWDGSVEVNGARGEKEFYVQLVLVRERLLILACSFHWDYLKVGLMCLCGGYEGLTSLGCPECSVLLKIAEWLSEPCQGEELHRDI